MTDTLVAAAVRAELTKHTIVLPPSAAVAGVYAMVDSSRGVWKSPANVSLTQVIEPAVRLDDATQERFNVDADTGKSINALRAFSVGDNSKRKISADLFEGSDKGVASGES